ncbi:MAG: phosphoglycerate mutase family protein [bacterium]|nr:phosphoglycerate mutase family protein [bacterium]
MGMPAILALVRHGKSEGNVVKKRSKQGHNEAFTNESFRNRHSSNFRLVEEGRKQLALSGKWIKENLCLYFDRYYVSQYIRAMESGVYLDLPDATWFTDFNLRERDWGDMDVISEDEKNNAFAESIRKRDINSFFWRPPNGESIAQVCLRVDRVIDTLHRECDGKKVIIVSHGELMWAWRIRLERMSTERYFGLDNSKDPKDHIDNGHILIYTRIDPATGQIAPYLNWMKSISPSNPRVTQNDWQEIIRPRYTNDELNRIVKNVPQIIF